jgi:hypothetical protein
LILGKKRREKIVVDQQCSLSEATHAYAFEDKKMNGNGQIFLRKGKYYEITNRTYNEKGTENIHLKSEISPDHRFSSLDYHKYFIPVKLT